MASEGSSPSRFTQKFLEVLATGIATAASIFLIAHFTGVFVATPPAPGVKQPLAIQDGPQGGTQGRPAEPAPPASAASVVNAAPVAAPPQSNTADCALLQSASCVVFLTDCGRGRRPCSTSDARSAFWRTSSHPPSESNRYLTANRRMRVQVAHGCLDHWPSDECWA